MYADHSCKFVYSVYNVCVCFTYLFFTEGHMVEWLDSYKCGTLLKYCITKIKNNYVKRNTGFLIERFKNNCSSWPGYTTVYLMCQFFRFSTDLYCHHKRFESFLGRLMIFIVTSLIFVLRFYGPVNPMGSCRARSVLPNHTFTGQA